MFVESLESLPEELRGQFVETEIDGKKGYQDKDSHELRQHMLNIKGENKTLKEAKAEQEKALKEFQEAEQAKLAKAREDALAEAESAGDIKRIKEEFAQREADLRKTVKEEARREVEQEFTQKQAAERATSIADNIGATLGIEKEDGETIAEILKAKGRVKVDPDTGKEQYYDDKGGALSVDREGFIALLKQEKRFARLIKNGIVVEGGGNINGNGQGGAQTGSQNKAADEAKKKGDVAGFIKANLNG